MCLLVIEAAEAVLVAKAAAAAAAVAAAAAAAATVGRHVVALEDRPNRLVAQLGETLVILGR